MRVSRLPLTTRSLPSVASLDSGALKFATRELVDFYSCFLIPVLRVVIDDSDSASPS